MVAEECNIPDEILTSGCVSYWDAKSALSNLAKMTSLSGEDENEVENTKKGRKQKVSEPARPLESTEGSKRGQKAVQDEGQEQKGSPKKKGRKSAAAEKTQKTRRSTRGAAARI